MKLIRVTNAMNEVIKVFKRENIQKRIESLHRNFPQIPGLTRRDLDSGQGCSPWPNSSIQKIKNKDRENRLE